MSDVFAGTSDARLIAACIVVVLYVTTCVYFLRPRRSLLPLAANPSDSPPTLIAFASQAGFAAELANRTAQSMQAAGTPVQDRIRECADDIRRWVDENAVIYVCGSLQGMAPGVDAALGEVLGAALLESLATIGKYRRDVY